MKRITRETRQKIRGGWRLIVKPGAGDHLFVDSENVRIVRDGGKPDAYIPAGIIEGVSWLSGGWVAAQKIPETPADVPAGSYVVMGPISHAGSYPYTGGGQQVWDITIGTERLFARRQDIAGIIYPSGNEPDCIDKEPEETSPAGAEPGGAEPEGKAEQPIDIAAIRSGDIVTVRARVSAVIKLTDGSERVETATGLHDANSIIKHERKTPAFAIGDRVSDESGRMATVIGIRGSTLWVEFYRIGDQKPSLQMWAMSNCDKAY